MLMMYAGTFPGRADQVTVVRKQVRDYLDECPVVDDVVLVLSEFCSNAILHSLSRFGEFRVRVEWIKSAVYLEVLDEGGCWIPPEVPEHPHGLDLVGLLTPFWGIAGTDDGRAVWALIDFPKENRDATR